MPDLSSIILLIPPVLFALTVHEYAHGWTAYHLGDPTAKMAGRLTLNPIAHLDPIGTILLFIAYFGWARPVPVNPSYFVNPRRDMVWVSLAGPVSNIIFAALLGAALRPLVQLGIVESFGFIYRMLTIGVFINLMLALFNLIPIPPLDGSKALAGLLPSHTAEWFLRLERLGPLVLLGLIIAGRMLGVPIFGYIIYPPADYLYRLFTGGAPLLN